MVFKRSSLSEKKIADALLNEKKMIDLARKK